MTEPTAARVKCPRCDRPLVRNHDELVCLTHGQAYEPVRAWESVAAYEPAPGRARNRPPRVADVPWTPDEHDLWRRAEAGEVFEPDHKEEEREPMTEMSFRTVDDLARPTLARLKEIVSEIATKERELVGLRDDGKRFVAVLEALRVEVPEAVRDGIRPRDGKHRMVAESERWTCVCGWKSKGRFPGGHTSRCAAHKTTPVALPAKAGTPQ